MRATSSGLRDTASPSVGSSRRIGASASAAGPEYGHRNVRESEVLHGMRRNGRLVATLRIALRNTRVRPCRHHHARSPSSSSRRPAGRLAPAPAFPPRGELPRPDGIAGEVALVKAQELALRDLAEGIAVSLFDVGRRPFSDVADRRLPVRRASRWRNRTDRARLVIAAQRHSARPSAHTPR